MKTKEEIISILEKLESDERVHYAPANVFINAPLALIQTGLVSKIDVLREVLGLPPFKRKEKKKS